MGYGKGYLKQNPYVLVMRSKNSGRTITTRHKNAREANELAREYRGKFVVVKKGMKTFKGRKKRRSTRMFGGGSGWALRGF